MIVPIPEDEFATSGLLFDIIEGVGVFGVPTLDPEVYETVKVSTDGNSLHFFPQRSSAHKRVLGLLGFNDA
jgi:hypothetical protein